MSHWVKLHVLVRQTGLMDQAFQCAIRFVLIVLQSFTNRALR